MNIRVVRPEDAAELLEIYRPYVENTAITFEYEVPSVEEFRGRIVHTLERYPYLIAEQEGQIIGYAYAGNFKPRAAYDRSVETTIYIRMGLAGNGYGRLLYEALERELKRMNVLNLNACIGYPEVEDEYLTKNSTEFHEHMGYRFVGKFHNCGYKFGRWYHMVWMEKMIGDHKEMPEEVIPYSRINKALNQ